MNQQKTQKVETEEAMRHNEDKLAELRDRRLSATRVSKTTVNPKSEAPIIQFKSGRSYRLGGTYESQHVHPEDEKEVPYLYEWERLEWDLSAWTWNKWNSWPLQRLVRKVPQPTRETPKSLRGENLLHFFSISKDIDTLSKKIQGTVEEDTVLGRLVMMWSKDLDQELII